MRTMSYTSRTESNTEEVKGYGSLTTISKNKQVSQRVSSNEKVILHCWKKVQWEI